MADLAAKLTKFAASYHLAALVLNQTHTRIRGQPRPILSPAIAGGSWETGIHARIVLYRDMFPVSAFDSNNTTGFVTNKVRFAEVMKKSGKVLPVRLEENIVPFLIQEVSKVDSMDRIQLVSIHSSA